jgi:hypothetical protein
MARRRRVLIALGFAIVAGVIIRLRGQNLHHEIKSDAEEEIYQAPFSNPNAYLEEPPIVPDAYIVHLVQGHTIDAHSLAINSDIAPHLDHILDTKSKVTTIYIGHNISDSLLNSIRSDRGVTLVEYETLPFPNGTSKPTYQAPLQGCDSPRAEIEPESYQVLLAPDYPLRVHYSVIGEDIEELIQNKYNFHTNKWVYSVKPVGRRLLSAIRSDRNVELVVCESRKKRQTEGDLRPKGEL